MSDDFDNRQNGHSRQGHDHGSKRGRLHWWQDSVIYRSYCRIANWLYDWWHPEPSGSRSHYGYDRSRRSRLGRAWNRVRRKLADSAPVRGWRDLRARWYDWWHPASETKSSRPGYGYYGQKRRSRLARLRHGIAHRVRQSAAVRAWGRASNAFYNWWYPLVEDAQPYPAYGYHGRRRRSRLALARSKVRRWLSATPMGRAWRRFSTAAWEWWYPEVDDAGRGYGYGYHGRGRVSRLALGLRKVRHRWRQSWLGQAWRRFSIAAWEWWYPEPDATWGGYGYHRVRVSRPVRLAWRAMKWCHGTWLGRKLHWLLDDVEAISFRLRCSLAVAFGEHRLQRVLTRWQTWALLLCLASAVGCGYAYGLPRYRALQERQYAQQADLWLKKGDLQRAMLRARQTLSLNPTNAIATRVRGDLEEIINSSAAMFWRRRAAILMPNTTNLLSLASTALKFEAFPYPIATKALKEVPPEARATFAYHYIAGSMAWKMNDLKEAERHYTEALKRDPQHPAARMSLAVVRLYSKDQAIVQDALGALEMLRSDRSVGLLALRSLVAESFARGDLKQAESLSSQVLTNAQASVSDHILHLNILKAGKRPGLPAFLKATQAKAGKNVRAIGTVAAWMTSSGYAREALDWLGSLPAEVARQGGLPLSVADAYVALGAWKDLEAYLLLGPWPGLDHVRYALLTLATWKQVGGPRQSAAWSRAVQVASASPVDLDMLAKLAGAWDWIAETEEVLWHAADQFDDQVWPFQRLEQFYTTRRNSAGLLRVCAARLQRNPEDRLAQNNVAMISLLLNRNVADAQQMAAELHQADPQNPIFTSTHAFSLHLQGRTKDALALLRELGLDQLDDPSMSLYYGVLLAADGQAEIARNYLKRAATATLLPEEAALLERANAR